MDAKLKPEDPRNCSVCGHEFVQTPEQVRKHRATKTCSDVCRRRGHALPLLKYDYPVTKPCEFCGADFLCHNSTQVLGNRFCPAHHYDGSRMHNGVLGPYACVDCGVDDCWQKPHDRARPPRCTTCAARVKGERLVRALKARVPPPSRLVLRECTICSGAIRRSAKYYATHKFVTCSHKCRREAAQRGLIDYSNTRNRPDSCYLRGPNHQNWRGQRSLYYGRNWKQQSAAARLRDNNTCQHCGVSRANYWREMDVHHIVRFLDFPSYEEANVLTNLISLCKKCHGLADAEQLQKKRAAGFDVYGQRPANQGAKKRRARRYSCLSQVVVLFTRNWLAAMAFEPLDGESSTGLRQALCASANQPRGLDKAPDMCQVSTFVRFTSEIEANCWQFTLEGQKLPDPRSWKELLACGDNTLIDTATRTHYYDWSSPDESNYVVINAGPNGNQHATKREWHV